MEQVDARNLVKTLCPSIFVPTSVGNIRSSGLLDMLIQPVGSLEEFGDRLIASGLPTQLLTPAPGETLELKIY